MSIRAKIILIVLPLILTTLLLTGISSYFSATAGITQIATEFLGFKAAELEKYATSQWSLLVENNFTDRPDYVAATQKAVGRSAQMGHHKLNDRRMNGALLPERVAVSSVKRRTPTRMLMV